MAKWDVMKTSLLRQKLIQTLTIKGYSPRTITSYVWAVASLSRHYKRSPDKLSDEEIRCYLYFLHVDTNYSASTINVVVNALGYLRSRDVVWRRRVWQLSNVEFKSESAK